MKLLLVAIILVLLLALLRPGFGFRSQRSQHYADTGPAFDIRTHLSGEMISEGMIYGPMGRVVSRFVATMNGTWDGNTGTLSEDFSYASSGTQQRKWFLTMGENGAFTATADDIIGTGEGQQSGAAVRLTYRIRLPESAGGHVLDVTDWMYLMENGTIMNRSEMRKFGIKVAELVATIRPKGN
ncbi:DUF3833 domain-containing protein [Phaeobacter gallaeciensis]|uniref:DUF3833 domain-containing protein n=1 Tax=Phaeobacter gallaeciensis TaxID=60890 RepID=A0AAC9Z8D5_9RHOB|nr:DUF3833 domain-containing protein [Phaeobacter gallaeciensis]AHD08455.1 hypothetical protein Gal_00670 [Phaeobacter gallaeciensis DSM 26640]ATE91721.1 hypothetical protein PhaeoP11_00666 [Phaeobacter gallaeciensis]ATE98455.1 hypothetical protein PhaeoP73_03178 [Phaeobacter gallaeciensis]ATF00337.1 hypothetical protein PhaeoP75_00667 [Phaeobacter gallaeciensis]ATF04769.1 hypothetical protein PhaeoP63_00667 [Phaeobacter gallaeciensis]